MGPVVVSASRLLRTAWIVLALLGCGFMVAVDVRVAVGILPAEPARLGLAFLIGVVPLALAVAFTTTCVEVTDRLVRVIGLWRTTEVRRSAVTGVADPVDEDDERRAPALLLAKGTQVLRFTRRSPNGVEHPASVLRLRGISPTRMKLALGLPVRPLPPPGPPIRIGSGTTDTQAPTPT